MDTFFGPAKIAAAPNSDSHSSRRNQCAIRDPRQDLLLTSEAESKRGHSEGVKSPSPQVDGMPHLFTIYKRDHTFFAICFCSLFIRHRQLSA